MPGFVAFLIIALLILLNALYVAAEFATASSRRSRLAQMAEEGNRLAGMVLPIVERPEALDHYIAACQLGITVTSLVLGYFGQATLAVYLEPMLARRGMDEVAAQSIAVTIVLLLLTFLQVLLGELVPKNIGIRYPERLAVATVTPLRWSMSLFRPLIWVFNGSARVLLKWLGHEPVQEHGHIHHPDEIVLLVRESSAGGIIDIGERMLVEKTLQMHEQTARQVMTPRTAILAASVETPVADLFRMLANSPYSRMPLYEGSIDRVVGVIHLKDLLCLHTVDQARSVRDLMKPPFFIPETIAVDDLFRQMQRARQHMAIVVDEFGGTAGLITLEDLLEEIFGEIQDEFDQEIVFIQKQDQTHVRVRGDLPVGDLNDYLDLDLPEDEATTVGGLILNRLGHVPREGESVQIGDVVLRVERMQGNRMSVVNVEAPAEHIAHLQEVEW
ncbi:MAG: HlyC/CorC family transporter [Chloroflexi bacterium]|nr:HlyC/CorC family transporter [Chloroflexota bacterium]